MNQDQDFIESYYDLVSEDVCNDIIKRIDYILSRRVSIYKQEHNKADQRVDSAIFAEHDYPEAHDIVNTALSHAIKLYTEKYKTLDWQKHDIVMPYSSQSVKLQKTPKGGGYHKWHVENSGNKDTDRVLAWTLYLNSFEGEAETEFLLQGRRINPAAGMIAIWPGCWTHVHRGNPPYSKDKYIATGWFSFNGEH